MQAQRSVGDANKICNQYIMPNFYKIFHTTFSFMAESSFMYVREGDGIVTFNSLEGKYRIVMRAWVDDDDWADFHKNIGETTPDMNEIVTMIRTE